MELTDLVILLHTQSVSYCYYKSNSNVENWIPLDVLKGGIKFALKNNLFIQFVYPNCKLPENYKYIIDSVKHLKIMPSCIEGQEDSIKVFSSLTEFTDYPFFAKNCILHIEFAQIEEAVNQIIKKGDFLERLNLIIDDVESVQDSTMDKYRSVLEILLSYIKNVYDSQKEIHVNILTDRMFLHEMNNCNAGVRNLTLAPNGCFYICPAFYLDNPQDNVGNLQSGILIKNKQLYQLEYAPICRICDAYQCKRCIWLNRKMTLEVNTPSHEQCIMSHIERNTSKLLLDIINRDNTLIDNNIKEINYIDPFDKIK